MTRVRRLVFAIVSSSVVAVSACDYAATKQIERTAFQVCIDYGGTRTVSGCRVQPHADIGPGNIQLANGSGTVMWFTW